MTVKPTIILIKRPKKHDAHHGGAWKVAYADFVTAMMALFIVLWLLNSSQQVRDAVSGYFRDPAGVASKAGTDKEGSGKNVAISALDMEQLKRELENRLKSLPDFDKLKNHIEITITDEGLRIELLEDERGTFFDLGSPEPNSTGRELLSSLAQYLGGIDNKLSIEGHTDSKPYSGRMEYTNWELSADRANAARRLMRRNGIRSDQVSQVRGFADQNLRKPQNPLDPSNRRISLIVLRIAIPAAGHVPEALAAAIKQHTTIKAAHSIP